MFPVFDPMSEGIPTKLRNYDGIVDEIKDADILCGSKNTALISKHPGNIALRDMVTLHLGEYENADTKQEKMHLNRSIINAMRKKYGSRFLRQKANGSWVEVEGQAVRDKVSHALRFASIQKKKDEEYSKCRAPVAQTQTAVASAIAGLDPALQEDESFTQRLETVHSRQQAILNQMINHAAGREINEEDASVSSDPSCVDC